jgi:hypothetical protein
MTPKTKQEKTVKGALQIVPYEFIQYLEMILSILFFPTVLSIIPPTRPGAGSEMQSTVLFTVLSRNPE